MNRKITALLLLIILLLQLSSCGTDSPFRRNTGNRKEDMSGQQEEQKENPSENPGEDPGGQGEQPPDNGDYTVPLDGVGGLPPSSLTWINVPAAIEQTAASVVKLDVYDKHGTKVASGTAFAAIEEGLLLTAYHVIEKMDHANASGEAGLAFTVTEILASDAENDIAILKLPDDVKLPVIALGGEPLRGELMAVIGSQVSSSRSPLAGRLSSTSSSSMSNSFLNHSVVDEKLMSPMSCSPLVSPAPSSFCVFVMFLYSTGRSCGR